MDERDTGRARINRFESLARRGNEVRQADIALERHHDGSIPPLGKTLPRRHPRASQADWPFACL